MIREIRSIYIDFLNEMVNAKVIMKFVVFIGLLCVFITFTATCLGESVSNKNEFWEDDIERIRENEPITISDVSSNILGLFDVKVKSASVFGLSDVIVNSYKNNGNNNVVASVTIPFVLVEVDTGSVSSKIFNLKGNVNKLDFAGIEVTVNVSLSYTKSPLRLTKLSVDSLLEGVALGLLGNLNGHVIDIATTDAVVANAVIQERKDRTNEILLIFANAVLKKLYPA